MGLIYKITNQINGKIYIGQTIGTLSKRWREHCFEASNGTKTYYCIRQCANTVLRIST